MQRALPKAYIIDGDGELRARGERSYLFWYAPPSAGDIERARQGETVIIQDWENNQFWALLQLSAFPDHFLYVSRDVDGKILSLLDETQATVRLYEQLEADRGRLLFEFALVYIGFALVVILGAMWTGLWFAERLSRPVGTARLGGGARRARRPRRAGARGEGRRRDRAARADVQRDDPAGEGPARRAHRRQRRDRAAAAAVRTRC